MLNPNTDFPLTFVRSREKMREQVNAIRAGRRRIVLLEMDNVTRYLAHQENSSEVAMQAKILRALQPHHTALIVLPMPTLTERRTLLDYRLPDALPTRREDILRSNQDIPELKRAIQSAKNVAIMMPKIKFPIRHRRRHPL